MMAAFRLCPFCGSEVERPKADGLLFVCKKCPARVFMETLPDFAVAAFDSRTPDPLDLLLVVKKVLPHVRKVGARDDLEKIVNEFEDVYFKSAKDD